MEHQDVDAKLSNSEIQVHLDEIDKSGAINMETLVQQDISSIKSANKEIDITHTNSNISIDSIDGSKPVEEVNRDKA